MTSDYNTVLISASQSCSAALSSLSQQPSNQQHPPPIKSLQTDLSSLLSLLHSASTKSALALNPSAPSYPASLAPLHDLSTHVPALAHCALLFSPAVHGATVSAEAVATARDVIDAVRVLVLALLSPAREEYILRTGAVHEAIDQAKSAAGLSTDNLCAVRKKWARDRGVLEDAVAEVDGMVQEEGSEGADDNGGWDELGVELGPGKKMDAIELERTKQVHTLLRLTVLLHKRVLDLLSTHLQNPALDALPPLSTSLLASTDDLISTLYTPQIPTSISAELATFIGVIKALQASLEAGGFFRQGLEERLAEMSLRDAKADKQKKWFDTCFEQIYKSSTSLSSILEHYVT